VYLTVSLIIEELNTKALTFCEGGGGVISILKSVILKNCVLLDDFDEIRLIRRDFA